MDNFMVGRPKRSAAGRIIRFLSVVTVVLAGCGQAVNQPPSGRAPQTARESPPLSFRESALVSREQLEKMLFEPELRILDTRPEDEFATLHIPGAIPVDPTKWNKQGHAPGGLIDADYWAKAIGDLGIGPETTVVVYGGKAPPNAARAWWHLKFAGVEHAMLLDGGWPRWQSARKPTESERTPVKPAEFVPRFRLKMLADKDAVLEAAKKTESGPIVVDARSIGEYEGKDVRGPRGGHVPGAIQIEWTELLDVNGQFKDDKSLRKLFAGRGIRGDASIITHCQSGGRSSVEVFGMLLAGYKNVRNYYGGWSEWSAAEEAPVE